MKLISATVNLDGSWDVEVEQTIDSKSVTRSVHVPASITPFLTSASSIQTYLNNQVPAVSMPTALKNIIGTNW